MAGNMDSVLLLKFIGYFPDYVSFGIVAYAFFGQAWSKQLYTKLSKVKCILTEEVS